MATSDAEQKSASVPQHKRMAMGAPITGTSTGGGASAPRSNESKQQGGALMQAKKK